MSLTDDQRKLRATRYGSSEVAAICGIGPGSAIDVYLMKVDPASDVRDENLLMELGTLLEEPVAQVFARRSGTFLATCGSLVNPRYPLAVCTPDRAVFRTEDEARAAGHITTVDALENALKILEVKTTGQGHRKEFGREGSGQVPEAKAVQAVWQLGLTGKDVCDMPVLFRGDFSVRLEVFTVAANPDLFGSIYEMVSRFDRDFVKKRVPPPPDASDSFDEAIQKLHPYDRKAALVADAEDERLMLEFLRFRAVEKRAEHFKKLVSQQIKLRMGEAGGLTSSTLGKISWTRSKDGSEVDWNMAANDALTLAGQCIQAFGTLREHGEHLKPEIQANLALRLKQIVPDATRVKGGFRSLRAYPKKGSEADLSEAALKLTLAPLKLGDGK